MRGVRHVPEFNRRKSRCLDGGADSANGDSVNKRCSKSPDILSEAGDLRFRAADFTKGRLGLGLRLITEGRRICQRAAGRPWGCGCGTVVA